MTKLSDTQAVILSAACPARRRCRPAAARDAQDKGGAVAKVLGSLKAKGLIDHHGAPRGDDPPPLRITRAGLAGHRRRDRGRRQRRRSRHGRADRARRAGRGRQVQAAAGVRAAAPAPAARPQRPRRKAKAKAAKPGKAAPAEKPTPRAGTKQALMIEMLKRPEGATVEQIAAATGWQQHTIRGAISGALKKKLGLTVEATRTREVGPNKTGAKGSTTVYRITGSATARGPNARATA